MGMLVLYVMPVLIGSIIGIYGIDEGTAGIIFSLELCAMALAGILLSMNLHKNILRKVACVGIITIVLGNIASYYSASLIPIAGFVAIRIVVGMAEGCLLAAANSIAAGMAQPDRVYAAMGFGQVIPVLIAFVAIPIFVESMGDVSAYLVLGGLAVVALPFILAIPNKNQTISDETQPKSSKANKQIASRMLIGFFAYVLGGQALWAYIERVGFSVGLDITEIGAVLALATVGGLVGPLVAGLIGTRFGRATPIFLGATTLSLCYLGTVYTTDGTVYSIMTIAVCTVMVFVLPFIKGLFAHYDPSGRLNAVAMGIYTIGAAGAPMLAGSILIAGGTYKTIAWFGVAMFALMLALIIGLAAKSVKKQQNENQTTAALR